MKFFIASDHAGFELKNKIKDYLETLGLAVEDLGPTSFETADDYPDYALPVAKKVAAGEGDGILICDTGIGMAIAANKVKGVRAALVTTPFMAQRAREHNNVNVLVLGAEINKWVEVEEILNAFLSTRFSPDKRHLRRLEKIEGIENG